MKRSVLILLVAGIIAILSLLATRTQTSPEGVPAPETKAEVVESRPEAEAEAAAPAADRTEIQPAEENRWRVRVLEAQSGAPVAGATVSRIDLPAVSRELAARGIGFDTLEGLRLRRESALEERTGADGCAAFASLPAGSMVEARAGSGWAFAVVGELPADRTLTLRLAPDRELRVRVVDAAGAAVGGVPVALRRQTGPRAFSWKWTDTEAATGLATFLHFQRRLEQGSGWHALLAFPVREQQVLPVDAETRSEPPPTLVLPETGSLRVRLRASDGGLPSLEGVELHAEARENGIPVWLNGPWARPRVDARGEALFPWIGLGLELQLDLHGDGEELARRTLSGPVRAGEELRCELVLPRPSVALVSGRFVLRDGRAWSAASVRASPILFPLPDRPQRTRSVAVAGDGRFRLEVHEARPANGTRAYRIHARHPGDGGELLTDIPLDREVPPEGLELGDVLLDYGELLVSGRVVDADRRPIAGASCSLEARTLVSDTEYWPLVLVAGSAQTGAEGGFALYLPPGAAEPREPLRLEVGAPGYVAAEPRPVRSGERDVEVVLERAGALAGSLELGDGLVRDDVALFLAGDTAQYVPLRDDSTFEAPGLAPGRYSLAVRRTGASGRYEREPAARVEGLVVVAGETCRDPRIQGLRIGSPVPGLSIRVVDRASTPIHGAAVSIVGGSAPSSAPSGADGVCVVRSEVLPVELEVSAFGYLRQRVLDVSTDREVVLEAGIPIRLRTSARPSGGEPKYLLGVMLYSVDAAGVRRGLAWGAEFTANYSTNRTQFDERGELALRMPAAGVYECSVHVTVLSGGVGRGATVELSPEPRITVLASEAEQIFELSIPEAAVEAALERALK